MGLSLREGICNCSRPIWSACAHHTNTSRKVKSSPSSAKAFSCVECSVLNITHSCRWLDTPSPLFLPCLPLLLQEHSVRMWWQKSFHSHHIPPKNNLKSPPHLSQLWFQGFFSSQLMVQSLIPTIANSCHNLIRVLFLPFLFFQVINNHGKSQMLKSSVGQGRAKKLLFHLFKRTLNCIAEYFSIISLVIGSEQSCSVIFKSVFQDPWTRTV